MKFWDFIKNFFSKKPDEDRYVKYATGVLIEETPDYRTPELGAVQATSPNPPNFTGIEPSLLVCGFFNQKMLSICVPSAISKLAQAYIHRKTGQIIPLHARLLYKLSKKFDGIPNLEGTYPRITALLSVKFGIGTTKTLPDDTSLPMSEYLAVNVNKEVLDDARAYKLPGFATVLPSKEDVKNAIYQNGAICGATSVGFWNSLPLSALPQTVYHYTIWYKYETLPNGDLKIYIWNSWGPNWLSWVKNWLFPGRGYFLWSEYQNYVRDIIAFVDIPQDFLNKIKKMPFRFTKELAQGVNDIQVSELQKMLNEDPDTIISLEGAGSSELETNYFGKATLDALKRWQTKHKLPSTGYFGQMSIKEANKRIGTNNLIGEWASAIEKFEGGGVNDRNTRNRNPGNIKYFGIYIPMAIGKDSGNFCIFETYEKGRNALETLLIRACSGLSSVYSPEDTLYDFYDKYAPAGDNNYPKIYADFVIKRLGISPNTPIKYLL